MANIGDLSTSPTVATASVVCAQDDRPGVFTRAAHEGLGCAVDWPAPPDRSVAITAGRKALVLRKSAVPAILFTPIPLSSRLQAAPFGRNGEIYPFMLVI